jgi:tetratricopeptide (TPR) repeat protein
MKVYTAKHAARLLDFPVDRVRSFARNGILEPVRGSRGEYRFSFQDLVLLRTAKELLASRIPPRKVRAVLRRLKERLPAGRPLTGVRITAEGERVVVRDDGSIWNAETGQALFDFDVAELAREVAPHARREAERAFESDEDLTPEDWFSLGTDLESAAPDHAQEAYRRALDLDPQHFETRLNLGRLLHAEGRHSAAEAHYRLALSVRPGSPRALFNLGVCLEDQGRSQEAVRAYRGTIRADPECADAHYNLAGLYEGLGDAAAALRHLQTYRELTETD